MQDEPTRPHSVPTPETVGPYRIERLIGRGGMGDVLQAWDPRLQRRVAIKYVRSALADDLACRSRLRREARMIASLSHPAIIEIFDILQTPDGGEQIVMEFVDGPTLKELLEAGPVEPETAVRLGLEIVHGLTAAHERGVLHRDLKAENVMLTLDGKAKILDFGLSKQLRSDDDPSLTIEGSVIGTARVMSPEQAEGQELDGRSDLFSFGVLLYEMVSGETPFRGSSAVSTLLKIRTEPHPDLREVMPRVPNALRALIDGLLQKDRDDRPSSAREVAATLESMTQGMASDSALLRSRIRALRNTGPQDAAPRDDSPSGRASNQVTSRAPIPSASFLPPTSILSGSAGRRSAGPARWRRRSPSRLATLAAVVCLCLAGAWWLRAQEPRVPREAQAHRAAPAFPARDGSIAVSSAAVPSAAVPDGSRIVVLPLANHGPAENGYFAAGLTNELVRELAYRQDLEVVSYRLSRNCGTDSWSIPDLGSELNVTHVLEGDVAWEPNPNGEARLRVGLQLIRVDDGRVLLSRSFDRSAGDVLRVQGEIADFVSRDLRAQLVYGGGWPQTERSQLATASAGVEQTVTAAWRATGTSTSAVGVPAAP